MIGEPRTKHSRDALLQTTLFPAGAAMAAMRQHLIAAVAGPTTVMRVDAVGCRGDLQ